jgi:hypothetical protein
MKAGELIVGMIDSMARIGITPEQEVKECVLQFKMDEGTHVVRLVRKDEVMA